MTRSARGWARQTTHAGRRREKRAALTIFLVLALTTWTGTTQAAPGLSPADAGLGPSPSGPIVRPAPHTFPRRIITLAPHITELVFAAGAGDRIVGTVSSSDYPPQARHIPRVGNGIELDTERIVALRPDLILAWQPSGATRALAPLLSRLHIPLAYVQPHALRDIPAEVAGLGRRLGTTAIADPEAHELTERIAALAAHYEHQRVVSTFIEVGAAPLYTLGKAPLINDALRVCGGSNIFAGAAIPAPQVSIESVLRAQPDAIIIPSDDTRRVAQRTHYWADLSLRAALDRHVYGIDPDELFRPGPRVIDATQTLCQDLAKAR
ncbi:MAG TPA: cobalamin-binding protein [Burkholderiaceae bacterium]|nr:cobalamin-binding protein [Burkholderiaceae bacterium]